MFATPAQAQTSQFLFDPNGNLTVQMGATLFPPQITGQPQNQVVAANELAAFSVIVADPRSLTYQWRFNNANMGGSTNAALLLENVSTSNEGEYRVVLTNPSGSVTSAPAMLWIDNDADGMGDSWEIAHFAGLGKTATGDADGDGVSNLQEFLDDTDPTDPNSTRYRLLVIRDGGSVVKTFDQVSYTNGESVTLTASASPGGEPFHAWLGDIVTRSNPVTLVMTNNKTVFARFTPIDFLWTNATSGAWETAANWTPNLAPGLNDNVVITNGVTVTLNTPADCAQVALSGAFSPVLTGIGSLTVRAAFLWTAGTMSGSGRTIVESNATFTLANTFSVTLSGRTLENGGTVLATGAGNLALQSGTVITNRPGAIIELQSAGSIVSTTASNRIDNAGTFRKLLNTGTTTIPATVGFNNSGTVEILGGTLNLAGGVTNTGSFNVAAGAELNLAGGVHMALAGSSMTGAGHFTVSGGTANLAGLVNISGSNTFSGGTANLTGNYICTNNALTISTLPTVTVNLNGTGLVAPAVVNLSNGTLAGSNVVTVLNQMNWTSGTMSGSGRTIISPGATLNAAIPSAAFLSGRTLDNSGTVIWTGAGTFSVTGGAVITNRPGALFHVQNAATLGGGLARFDNAGTFRKSINAGTTTFVSGIDFNNSGLVEIQSGTLLCSGTFANSGAVNLSAGTTIRLAAGGVSAGLFTAAATALVEWTGGTFTLNPGAQLNGAGFYRLNGGTLTANPDLTVENLDLINANSTLGGTGVLTIAGAMNWTAGTMSGSARTIISPGATLNAAIPNVAILSGRTLDNGGTVVWTGAGTFSVTGGAVLTNRPGALFQAQNAAILGNGLARFDNAGTFRKSINAGTTTFVNGMDFNNSGLVEIQSGTLLCSGNFTNSGAVNLSPGTTKRLAGGGSATSPFNAPATALVEWTAGSFTLNPGAQLNGAGLYRLNGGTLTANPALTVENLELINANSTLGGTGVLTIAGAMNWTAGTMSGSTRTIISSGANLNAAIPNVAILSGRTLDNGGTVIWTGAGTFSVTGGAVITNRPGGLFHVQNAASLGGGTVRFDNAGTFRKSINAGTTTFANGMNFNNSGLVEIRSGKLAANGGYTSTPNALLNCALGGTTAGTNYGQLQIAGTVPLNGGLSVDLLPGFTPATNDTFTVLTAGSRNSTFASFTYPVNRVTMQLSNAPNAVIIRVAEVFPIPQPVLMTPELLGPNVMLTWTATSNVTYRLQFNPDASSTNWNALPGDVITLSNTASKLDALTSSNRFYRVRVLP